MLDGGHRGLRLAAALLAASALQACANNPLAMIDGPFIPASERVAAAQPEPVAAPEAAPEPAAAAEPVQVAAPAPPSPAPVTVERPLAEQVPPEDLAYPDQAFVGPVLTAPEMAALASSPAPVVEEAASPLPDAVDADFLPPEPEPEPEPPARVFVAAPSAAGGPVGPDSGPAEPPVELATRLPSAFDFAPPPPPRLTAPRPDAALEPLASGFAAFHRFAITRLAAPTPRTGRTSMLLVDPPSLDPALMSCGNRPPAVLLDLDPANALAPLAQGRATPDSVELGSYLADLRQRGVTVYWITGHGPEAASAIRRRLVASGLDSAGGDPLIVTRFAGESKQARRQGLGDTHCLLAILGDQMGDFDELYDFLLDPSAAAPLDQHVGNGWFLTPPPLD